jgi:hypothetical protein
VRAKTNARTRTHERTHASLPLPFGGSALSHTCTATSHPAAGPFQRGAMDPRTGRNGPFHYLAALPSRRTPGRATPARSSPRLRGQDAARRHGLLKLRRGYQCSGNRAGPLALTLAPASRRAKAPSSFQRWTNGQASSTTTPLCRRGAFPGEARWPSTGPQASPRALRSPTLPSFSRRYRINICFVFAKPTAHGLCYSLPLRGLTNPGNSCWPTIKSFVRKAFGALKYLEPYGEW